MLIETRNANTGRLVLCSTAANAYDLCNDVCKAIHDEPKRYNQGNWGTTNVNVIVETLAESKVRNATPPQCGTMACRAGWLNQLAYGSLEPFPGRDIEDIAYQLLGSNFYRVHVPADDESQAYRQDIMSLFSGSAIRGLNPGTRAYAREGVRGLSEFMEKWEARLKATAVPPRADTTV